MTWCCYSDFNVQSPNGRYELEARSPHNGKIDHRDGTSPSEEEFSYRYGKEQKDFRYRLIDHGRPILRRWLQRSKGRLVWERWQNERECSPIEALVTDDGWSIILTHGWHPDVIVVSPRGDDVLRVKINPPRQSGSQSFPFPDCSWTPVNELPYVATGGFNWTHDSWRYFLEFRRSRYFIWRTVWGSRLILDLYKPALLAESELPVDLARAIVVREIESVEEFLQSFSDRMNEVREWFRPKTDEDGPEPEFDPGIQYLDGAFRLVGVHRIASVIPHLREWERIDRNGCDAGTAALYLGTCHIQSWRPMIHHVLRLLGEEPLGYAAYTFTNETFRRIPMAELVLDRRARTDQIRPDMSAAEVLRILGAPDNVRFSSLPDGDLSQGVDEWEYDSLSDGTWTTYRIVWAKQRIIRIDDAPASWLNSERRDDGGPGD